MLERPAPLPVTEDALAVPRFQALDLADLDAIERLHALSLSTFTDRTLVKPETRGFFEAILQRRGAILGYRDGEGALRAYGVLMRELPEGDQTHALLGLAPETPLYKLAGAAVDPAWRGRGLQRVAIRERLRWLAEAGVTHGFATAAPGNVVSWVNLLNEGFRIRALVTAYGTLLRYLMVRQAGQERHEGPVEWRAWQDIAWQRPRLAAGWQGVAWRQGAAGGGFEAREIAFAAAPA